MKTPIFIHVTSFLIVESQFDSDFENQPLCSDMPGTPCCPIEDENCYPPSSNESSRCFCDLSCVQFGDCCKDYARTCAWIQPNLNIEDQNFLKQGESLNLRQNFTFSNENDFFKWILQNENIPENNIQKLLSHGCNCPLLDSNIPKINFGGLPLDEFDSYCKNLLRHRHCLSLEPSVCKSDIFEISYDFEINQYFCENNQEKSCSRLKCEANLLSGLKVADFLRLNEDLLDNILKVNPKCRFPEKMNLKHDTCCLENLHGYNQNENGASFCNETGLLFYEHGSAFKMKYFEIY